MGRRNRLTLIGIILLVAFASCVLLIDKIDLPLIGERDGMKLGLDLQGGTNLIYEADFSDIPSGERSRRLDEIKRIIERRINKYGVAEPVIQTMGSDRISIQLPGVTDVDEAKDLVGKTALLEFWDQTGGASAAVTQEAKAGDAQIVVNDAGRFSVGDIITIGPWQEAWDEDALTDARTITDIDQGTNTLTLDSELDLDHEFGEAVQVWLPATGTIDGEEKPLTGIYLKDAEVDIQGRTNEPVVRFEWDSDGAELFSQITGRLIGMPLGIVLDSELISAPVVRSQIRESGIIEGLDVGEAQRLAIQLDTGALPVPLTLVREQTVDATLGEDSLDKSLIAGIVGLALVLAFMIIYYRLPGVLASFSLLIYTAFVLSIFKMVPVTLTLAGLAALIISIGMAVDANILIFERTKEELRARKGLKAAIEAGFDRAWPSIRDSNVSTFITCAILYWFGDQFGAAPVMGFALTLFVGVAVSMFTAIIVTRTFLRVIVLTPVVRRVGLFRP
ncbi:MAG: protein translocase subunit SecD [Chloroflexi bacterium]|nr:protein translocase subunit SecD [Chloroflexota bacterium]